MRKFVYLIFFIAITSLSLMGCKKNNHSLELNTDFKVSENLKDGGGRPVKVILLMGQSNATGCSLNEYLKSSVNEEEYDVYNEGFSNVLINYSVDNQLNTSNGEFVKTSIGYGHTTQHFGPELGMAEVLSKEYPNETIIILKYTYSGSNLKEQWLDNYKRGDIYKAAIKFITTYMNILLEHNYDAKIGAICWMQGESDANGTRAKTYYKNQSKFVSYLREDLKRYALDGGIYFIDAGISDISAWVEYKKINDAKFSFSKDSHLNLYFSTIDAGLTTLNEPIGEADIAHYDALSELKLGHLFGEYIVDTYKARN